MTEHEIVSIAAEDDGRLNPRKAFYMLLPAINNDGTVNPEETVLCTTDALAGAVELSKAHAEEEGEAVFIYECRPVRRVARGPIRVQPLMKPHK